MTGSEPQPEEVFEIERIRQLVELMEQHGLSEIDLRHEQQRIRLRRGGDEDAVSAHQVPVDDAAADPDRDAPGQRAEDPAHIVLIKSPMVGTFYGRPNPDARSLCQGGRSRFQRDDRVHH